MDQFIIRVVAITGALALFIVLIVLPLVYIKGAFGVLVAIAIIACIGAVLAFFAERELAREYDRRMK